MHRKFRALLFIGFFLLVSLVDLKGQRVSRREVPDAVIESFRLAHPGPALRLVKWERSELGYQARVMFFQKEIISLFQSNGEWVSTRWSVLESSLPVQAHEFIKGKYPLCHVRRCYYEEDRWSGRHYYVVLVNNEDKVSSELCFDFKGEFLDLFPAVVQKSFSSQFPLSQKIRCGQEGSFYKVRFVYQGEEKEAFFLQDGTLVWVESELDKSNLPVSILDYMDKMNPVADFVSGKHIVYGDVCQEDFSSPSTEEGYHIMIFQTSASGERRYFLLTFDKEAVFVSSVPCDYEAPGQ